MIYLSQNTQDTEGFAQSLANKYPPPHTFCLKGELGAGKTALTRGLARGYGYEGRVTSPTFTIMNVYEGKTKIHHFDLYRLTDEDELFDIGFEPSEKGVITVIEWFDSFAHLFDEDRTTLIAITKDDNDENKRQIEVTEFSGKVKG